MRLSEAADYGSKLVGRREAIFILQNVTGFAYEDIIMRGDTVLCKKSIDVFLQKMNRLADGEPLQYVLGKWDFCGIEFIVDNRALIPRQETELLVEAVLGHVNNKQQLNILDVCTGSGCVGISIAVLTGFKHNIVLADVSDKALSLAKENCLRLLSLRGNYERKAAGRSNPAMHGSLKDVDCFATLAMTGNICIIHSDLLDTIPGEFDIIVSNPPYIISSDMASLPENVKNFEPQLALNGGPDGLDIYRRLIPQSFVKLKPGGMIFLEIGAVQALEIMQKTGFTDVKIQKDYSGIDRILQGVKCHV